MILIVLHCFEETWERCPEHLALLRDSLLRVALFKGMLINRRLTFASGSQVLAAKSRGCDVFPLQCSGYDARDCLAIEHR